MPERLAAVAFDAFGTLFDEAAAVARHAAMAAVSANPWDTQAAHHAGFRALRVNRTGAPDEDGLAAAGVASLPDLAALPAALGA